MTLRVHQVEGEFRVVLTAEQMEQLQLTDGAAIEVVAAAQTRSGEEFEYVSAAEAMQAFEETYAAHESSYLELAK
jgi:hypothetical protein